ncbi:hypothetical protein A3Q56_00437 [Intoshia linei]|uniref:Uncharacterized protein n=1 Tax=Intoshia linei TaxID=1819745 RepID=A0A177BBW8_9BILA|nr:hypothetical protein A3Q56_00437 [Intoshia linei]
MFYDLDILRKSGKFGIIWKPKETNYPRTPIVRKRKRSTIALNVLENNDVSSMLNEISTENYTQILKTEIVISEIDQSLNSMQANIFKKYPLDTSETPSK